MLSVVEGEGAAGLIKLIKGLDQKLLGDVEIVENGQDVLIKITRSGADSLVVRAGDDGISPWVDLQLESDTPNTIECPKQAAFYSIWGKFVSSELSYPEAGSDKDNAVYLIATLESQVMNGGFGQYLTNTDGAYLVKTYECLKRIGATNTHALLCTAVELAAGAESFVAAWDDKPEQYARLDQEFSESAEDLAALTADTFLF